VALSALTRAYGASPPTRGRRRRRLRCLRPRSGLARAGAGLGRGIDLPHLLLAGRWRPAFVLAGQLRITVAQEQITLEQGDAYTFPAGTEHTFRAISAPGRTQVLWVFSPALPDTGLDPGAEGGHRAAKAGAWP
jgi:hypothetical protein